MSSNAKNQERWRERLKQDENKLKEHKDKQAERMREYRKRKACEAKNNSKILKEKRNKDRVRQQKCRAIKKNSSTQYKSGYLCKQTLSKAIKKVERALPRDAIKKGEVLQALCEKYPTVSNKAPETPVCSIDNMQEKIKVVQEFYIRDDISVQAPGRKDTLICNKQVVAKRYMIITVSEAYEVYKSEVTSECLSKSQFFHYRPSHVKLLDRLPHNMCVCKYHANFAFLLKGCAKAMPLFPSHFEPFLRLTCCNILDEKCMVSDCEKCIRDVTHDLVPIFFLTKMEENVKWSYWRKVDDRLTLSYTIAPLADLLHELEIQLPAFKLHYFIKRAQQKYFDDKKQNLSNGELILQMDFAENYRLINQNEIQEAHFSYQQVTIFTCVAWLRGETESFAVISEKLTHNKYDVYCFLTKIVHQIQSQYKEISTVFIFSDGSTSQFKNKYILTSIPSFVSEFGCKHFEWNFFATSHGKGAVDGIGAVVKRKVWQAVKANNIILPDAFAFYECARKIIKGVRLLYTSAKEIEDFSPPLNEKWKIVRSIPGIQKMHCFSYQDNEYINVARTGYSLKEKIKLD